MAEPTPMAIESVANPRVKRTLKLRKPRDRRAAGLLLAEGRREVERAAAARLRCVELWRCDALLKEPLAGDLAAEQVYSVSPAVLRKLAWHDEPEGVLGVFEAPQCSLDALPAPRDASLYLVAVGTEKPGNLGAMVRTAAAAGCDAVLAVGPMVDLFNPSAIRNSTAAVFSMPVVVVPEAGEAIAWLRGRGVSILSAVAPGQGGASYFEAAWSSPAAVVVGPEHAGLDAVWREAADARVTIPMAGVNGEIGNATRLSDEAERSSATVDSLNAANAAAILLYEVVRRRLV